MQIGLNAGFGSSLADEFADLAALGFTVARQDLYATAASPAAVQALVVEAVGAPLELLFLIGGGQIDQATGAPLEPESLARMTAAVVDAATEAGLTDYALEIGNEPDIAHSFYSHSPTHFAEALRYSYAAARAHGFTGPILSGGISNLNQRGLSYLSRLVPLLPAAMADLVIGMHRYPEAGRGPLAPHDGFRSRDEEWDALAELAEGRLVACTEFGYHTAASRPITLSDDDVAAAVLWDLAFYADRGVPLAVLYQLNDGPTESWIDRYGIRTLEGEWKPVADAIRITYGPKE